MANLIQIVREGILFGVHGATLHWGKKSWELDSSDPAGMAASLSAAGILPESVPQTVPNATAWDSSFTWLGNLPRQFAPRVDNTLRAVRKTFPTGKKINKDFRELLASTILERHHTAWSLCRRLSLECLKRNRRITRNFMRGKPPPPYRPIYATIDTYKATFPPSQASYNAALAYLRTGFAVDAITFSMRAPALSLSRAQFPDVWIAVLALHSRHGEAAVHLLDTLEDQGKQHPMVMEFRPEDILRRRPA